MIPPYRVRYAPICLWNLNPSVLPSNPSFPAVQKMMSRLRTSTTMPKIMPTTFMLGLPTPNAGRAVNTTTPTPAMAAMKGMNLQNVYASSTCSPLNLLVRKSHPVMGASRPPILVVASHREMIARNPPMMATIAHTDRDPLPVEKSSIF